MSGRIRSIKPELLEDAKTAGLSDQAFRLFIAMILLADDYGNCRAEAKFLEGQVYWAIPPETLVSVSCKSLETLVSFYVVRGQVYAHINGWSKHQRVQHPGKPRVPGPGEADSGESPETLVRLSRKSPETLAPDLRPPTSDHRPPVKVDSESLPTPPGLSAEESERIRTLAPKPANVNRGTRLLDDWDPPSGPDGDSWRDVARRRGLSAEQVADQLAAFKDYWRAAAGQRGVKLDWTATWRNWLRSARAMTAGPSNGHGNGVKQLPAGPGEYDWSVAAKAKAKVFT